MSKRSDAPVRGVTAPPPRITLLGAGLFAVMVALPVGVILWTVELYLTYG